MCWTKTSEFKLQLRFNVNFSTHERGPESRRSGSFFSQGYYPAKSEDATNSHFCLKNFFLSLPIVCCFFSTSGAPPLGCADGAEGNFFLFYRTRVGCSPASRPTLKKKKGIVLYLSGGRTENKEGLSLIKLFVFVLFFPGDTVSDSSISFRLTEIVIITRSQTIMPPEIDGPIRIPSDVNETRWWWWWSLIWKKIQCFISQLAGVYFYVRFPVIFLTKVKSFKKTCTFFSHYFWSNISTMIKSQDYQSENVDKLNETKDIRYGKGMNPLNSHLWVKWHN